MGKKIENIVLSGHFGENNAGDEILLKSLISGLKEKISTLNQVTIITADVDNTIEVLQREKLDRLFKYNLMYSGRWGIFEKNKKFPENTSWLFRIVKSIKKSDYVLTGPGTLIKDNTNSFFMVFWLIKIFIAYIFRRNYCFIGIGVVRLKHSYSKLMFNLLKNNCSFFSTRDKQSAVILKDMDVPDSKIFTYSDLSFSLDAGFNDGEERKSGGVIGINLRDFSAKHYQEKVIENYYVSLSEFIYYLYEKYGYNFKFISFCTEEHQNDLASLSKLKFPKEFNIDEIIEIIYRTDLTELDREISECKAFIGTRYHSNCTALKCNVPLIALSYEEKTKNLFEDINLNSFVLDVESVSFGKLKLIWDLIESNYSDIKLSGKKNVLKLKESALKHFDLLRVGN